MKLRNNSSFLLSFAVVSMAASAQMQEYKIDPAHSFVVFEVSHLGISTTVGQFEGIEGTFNFDDKEPSQCEVVAKVKTQLVDTNHAERDKHIRGEDFLNTSEYPEARFTSKTCDGNAQTGILRGNLEFMGLSKPIEIKITKVGEGSDPWGGYRAGFNGDFTINRTDFGINYNLGPATNEVKINVFIEGVRV